MEDNKKFRRQEDFLIAASDVVGIWAKTLFSFSLSFIPVPKNLTKKSNK